MLLPSEDLGDEEVKLRRLLPDWVEGLGMVSRTTCPRFSFSDQTFWITGFRGPFVLGPQARLKPAFFGGDRGFLEKK